MKIVITDCDHESINIEKSAIEEAGLEVSLHQAQTEDEVIAAASNAEVLIVQYAPITKRVLDALPNLKAISRYGVGVDTIDVDAATETGAVIMNVPDYGTEEVADHAISLTLSALRGITRLDRQFRQGDHSLTAIRPVFRLSEQTFGVMGMGAIGRTAARKAHGLGFKVIGYDPFIAEGTTVDGIIEAVSLDRLVSESDVISLHVPLNKQTAHMVNDDFLSRMKDTAILVNTCRGGVVDTDALVRALESQEIYAAGLDVFEQEPLPPEHPLNKIENVVLTPHAAWYSEQAFHDMKYGAAENAILFSRDNAVRHVVNPSVLEKLPHLQKTTKEGSRD